MTGKSWPRHEIHGNQKKSIKNRILAAASAAGQALQCMALPLSLIKSKGERKDKRKKKIVIVGEGKVLNKVWGFGWRDEN